MGEITIRRSESLTGEISAPSSKSYTHRMLISALLSEGTSEISYPLVSDDTKATLEAIEAFGAKVRQQKDYWSIKGVESLRVPMTPINCKESGATMRFMIPIAALAPKSSTLTYSQSLEKRPITPLLESLKQLGTQSNYIAKQGNSSVRIHGEGIKGGKASIQGDISSQFVSGLMFACPRAKHDTEITLTTPLESRDYVKMTLEILSKHGIVMSSQKDFTRYQIPSHQQYDPFNHKVPGDFSSAAFLLAAAAITSSKVKITNLNYNTLQGDKAILDILREMGIKVRIANCGVEVNGKILNSTNIDARNIPDLVPVCAALACYSRGVTKIYNAKRLRYKESDRLNSLYLELKKMGAKILVDTDGLTVKGPSPLSGTKITPHNDHRIAMACAIAALGATGETIIQSAECVNKSYPLFYQDLRSLGANIIAP
jgi:3-phosphoshikimate 1-carboxyvinyltransferase